MPESVGTIQWIEGLPVQASLCSCQLLVHLGSTHLDSPEQTDWQSNTAQHGRVEPFLWCNGLPQSQRLTSCFLVGEFIEGRNDRDREKATNEERPKCHADLVLSEAIHALVK